MKRIFFILCFFSFCYAYSQSPQSFKYQALLRDKTGTILSEKNVSVKISILKSSAEGSAVYSETHATKTSSSGIINIEIGKGTSLLGIFNQVEWGKNSYFVKVEMDPTGNSTYELMGISQLLSVPYSLYAEKSGDEKWEQNANNNISYSLGNIGINTTTPAYSLDVKGTINATQLLINGAPLLIPSPWKLSGNNTYFNTGKVGIGTTTPAVQLEVDGGEDLNLFHLHNSNNSLGMIASVSSESDFHGSALIGKRSRGTFAAPATVAAGDRITGIYGSLYANNDYQNAGAVHMYVGANPGPSSYPVNIRFETTNTNETTRTERMRITERGFIGVNTSTPAYQLDVNGTINATQILIGGSPISASSSPWQTGTNKIFYNAGNIGIGTSTPAVKLDIDGGSDLNVLNIRNTNNSLGMNAFVSSNTDFHGSALIGKRSRGTFAAPATVAAGDRITGIYGSLYADNDYQNAGAVHMYVGANPGPSSYPVNIRFETTNTNEITRTERMRITERGFVGVNTSTPAYQLDVNGTINATQILIGGSPISASSSPWQTGTNKIFYNAGNIGIGTSTPAVKLDIDGGSDLNVLNIRNTNNSLGMNAFVSSNTDFHGSALIGKRSRGTFAAPATVAAGDRITGIYGSLYADNGYQNAGAVHMYVGTNPGPSSYPVNIRFETTNTNEITRTERMRITENGLVKVTSNDVYLEQVGTGVIMKSPNGQCWKMTVSDTGTPVFTSVTCP